MLLILFPSLKRLHFFLLIILLQISLILSESSEKCYSIKNCEICPELDLCEKCKQGFVLNTPKTKCKSNNDKIKKR